MQRYRHFRGPYGQADVKNGQEKIMITAGAKMKISRKTKSPLYNCVVIN
jgi:hypothetical protein